MQERHQECIKGSQIFKGVWVAAGPPTTPTESLDLHDYHECHRSTLGGPFCATRHHDMPPLTCWRLTTHTALDIMFERFQFLQSWTECLVAYKIMQANVVYFIVLLRVYVCDYVRASVSGLLRPFLSCGFYPVNLHSFIHSVVSVNFVVPKFCVTSEKLPF